MPPPLNRLVAFGRERICFVHAHHALLSAVNGDPQNRYSALAMVQRTHVRALLQQADTTGDLDARAEALLALLDVDYVEHQLNDGARTVKSPGDAWESVARKICGR